VIHYNLVLSPWFIDREPPITYDLKAILGIEFQEAILHPEHDGAHLSRLVFQGKIEVAGTGKAEVGDFSFNPHVLELSLQEGLDLGS
jgi:hypothetical protein